MEERHYFNIDNEGIRFVKDFAYFRSVINSHRDCSQEIEGRLRFGRATIEELEQITKSKDVSLENKVEIIHALLFPVTMYRCESWTVKNTDRKKNDLFEIWHWKRALQIP